MNVGLPSATRDKATSADVRDRLEAIAEIADQVERIDGEARRVLGTLAEDQDSRVAQAAEAARDRLGRAVGAPLSTSACRHDPRVCVECVTR